MIPILTSTRLGCDAFTQEKKISQVKKMEGLPRDVRTYLVRRYLRVRELRSLLCVSKMYYMMFKFFVSIQTVPFGGSYTPNPCVVCSAKKVGKDPTGWNNQGFAADEHRRSAVLPKRSIDHLAPKNGVVECESGHRYLCHAKDAAVNAPCPDCMTSLKKIKL